jgi:S1-C subfamily serine protease
MGQAYEKWKSGPGQVPFLGLWVENNESVLSQIYAMAPAGLIVTGVCPGAAADRAGLRAGDIILKVDGEFVRHPLVLSETAGKLALEVERDSKLLKVTLEAESHD